MQLYLCANPIMEASFNTLTRAFLLIIYNIIKYSLTINNIIILFINIIILIMQRVRKNSCLFCG